ncbi:MAG: MFS transporter, partial [Muribaculaceae bacterium]|nr:MFS transporter [Muribaculaceae bacterium]
MNQLKKISPWAWIPTLYFAEGIPYFIVNNISVLMLAKMGVPNGQMALFTSLLYLPWMIKPFWSPFVDIIKTKRWWIIAMQVIMSVAFVLLTLTVPVPSAQEIASGTTPISAFTITLILFVITAFASATNDISSDGFYMLALTTKDQAAFVGIRSTFYRLSSIFGQGVLVYIAGYLESHGLESFGIEAGNIPLSWRMTLGFTALIFTLVTLYHSFIIPRPANDRPNISEDSKGASAIFKEFANSFATFFKKKGLWLAIAFMLLFRLPEAFLIKMCTP